MPADRPRPAPPSSTHDQRVGLTLYINAGSELSGHAVRGAKALCERLLPGRYDLAVLDLESHMTSATALGVVATPTLVVTSAEPPRRYVGDLSRTDEVAFALGLSAPAEAPRSAG